VEDMFYLDQLKCPLIPSDWTRDSASTLRHLNTFLPLLLLSSCLVSVPFSPMHTCPFSLFCLFSFSHLLAGSSNRWKRRVRTLPGDLSVRVTLAAIYAGTYPEQVLRRHRRSPVLWTNLGPAYLHLHTHTCVSVIGQT
jgi:hypothetical protein